MNFIAEDGSGLVNANSLVDIQYVNQYFTDRVNVDWKGTDTAKQGACINATEYFEIRWGPLLKGKIEFPATPQALSFPRINFKTHNGILLTGVPNIIKDVISEYSLISLKSSLFIAPIIGATDTANIVEKRLDVGPITTLTKYETNNRSNNGFESFPKVDAIMFQFIVSTSPKVIR